MQSSPLFRVLVLTLLVAVLVPAAVLARGFADDPRLQAYLQVLTTSDTTIDSIGTMFEVIVRHELERRYPSADFEITGALEYLHGTTVVGELDLLVFRRSDGACVMVGEAKFWRNLSKAIKKARTQLQRFRDNLTGGAITRYRWKPDPERPFDDGQFTGTDEYQTWGPRGATSSGFTHAVDLAIDEGNWLLQQCTNGRTERFERLHGRHH